MANIFTGVRSYIGRIKNYFTRRKNPSNTLSRDSETDPVGYLERENLFDKFLKYTGKILTYVGFTAVALTGIGAAAIATQYIRGKWPFEDVPRNEYVITRNKINEKPSRPLRQGVNVFIRPFVEKVKENGLKATVSGAVQTASVKGFDIITQDGHGLINLQYNYQIVSPEGAARFYWDYDKDIRSIDNIIETAILDEVRDVKARDIPSGYTEREIYGKKTKVNFLEEAEKKANSTLKYQKTGIEITKFAITEARFDPVLEKAWVVPETAKQQKDAEKINQEREIIRQQGIAQQEAIMAQSTANTLGTYLIRAMQSLEVLKLPVERALDYAMQMLTLDTQQKMVQQNRRAIVGNIAGGASQTVNLGRQP